MSKPQDRIRWGILGCARITRRGLAPGIRASETGLLHALASRDATTARTWAKEFDVPKWYGSYEELLADSEVDAVYIPLPNELHRPWTIAAADAGKHVLCDKPLALSTSEAVEMADHCRSRGVLLMEGAMWRHQPRVHQIRRRIADGAIGQLILVRVMFSFQCPADDWRMDPARGGGPTWDIGTYGVNTCRLYAGCEPARVRASGRFAKNGVDLSVTALLDFPNGVLGTIDCSFEAPFRCEYELVGTEGAIRVPDAFLPGTDPVARWLRGGSNVGAGGDETLHFPGTNQYACMVDSLARSIKAGRLEAPAEDGVAQMRVLDAILTDAKVNRVL
jgi:D-xylose 1-dehydrogenase (NADP+, D-xylono-1,5-lactone-forming)